MERVSEPGLSSDAATSHGAAPGGAAPADAASGGPAARDRPASRSSPDAAARPSPDAAARPSPDATARDAALGDAASGDAASRDAASRDAASGAAKRPRWRRTRAGARYARNQVYALPGGRTIFKVGVAVLGGLIVALGLVLVPLPGPGWAIVFGGLAIWAIEFAWAARLLNWVRRQVRSFTQMMKKLHWTLRAGFSVAVIAVLLSIAWLWVKNRYGFETLSQFWEYVTTH